MNRRDSGIVCDLSRQAAARIRQYRLEAGMSQAQLGRAAGYATPTITVVEGGQRNLTFPLFSALAGALGRHPAVFFGLPGPGCPVCHGRPGPGFICGHCGTATALKTFPDMVAFRPDDGYRLVPANDAAKPGGGGHGPVNERTTQ